MYFPIPYAKHCKICTDKQDIYYHVDYRTYPKGTEIESLELEALAKMSLQLKNIADIMRAPRHQSLVLKDPTTRGDEKNLKPGEKLQISFEGPGLARVLSANVGKSNEADSLRSLVLIGTFDGAPRPQIWCPLGDFFASSPGVNSYESLPFNVTRSDPTKESYFQCWWPIPFQKSATFEVHNLSQKQLKAGLHIGITKCPWTDRSMHFHVAWQQQYPIPTKQAAGTTDWNYVTIEGKGVYLGDALTIFNPVPDSIPAKGLSPKSDRWTITMSRHPRLPGAAILDKSNNVVGIVLGDRDSLATQMPAIPLEAIRAFLAADAPKVLCANPDPSLVMQLTASREAQ